MEYDKKLHLIAGFVIALIIGLVCSDAFIGLFVALISGAGKEVLDSFGWGTVDEKDMYFTWVGGAIGAALVYVVL